MVARSPARWNVQRLTRHPANCFAYANRIANFVASGVASRVTTMLLPCCQPEKTCFYGGVAGLSWRRPDLCGCVWLANVAGLLIGRSGCRAGQRGNAGASPDCFLCCVSSLAISISSWPRILPVHLESSFLRWRCAVRVNGMENLLLVAT